ncbi:hypothetical protein CRENBAI_012957, partial [Crenichthys baileyi]
LSLSPTTSTPPSSVSPPSSLSSLSTSPSSSASPPSSGHPSSLTLSLSPTSSVAPPLLPLSLELGALGESEVVREESRSDEEEVTEQTDDDEGSGPPTKLVLLQTNHAPPSSSPRQHTDGSSASLLLVCQNTAGKPSQSTEAPPPAEISHQHLGLLQPSVFTSEADVPSFASSDPRAVAWGTVSRNGPFQFPDLISDLITEESSPTVGQPLPAPTPTTAMSAAVFPTGVRYVVPPQPSPSSSFLPFPDPLPAASSTRPGST